VDKLHDAQLPDNALDGAAMWACPRFPALLVDSLQDSCASQVIDSGAAQLFQELAPFRLLQEDFGAVLANILQRRLDVLQVADVEDGERQPNVAEVARTVLQTEMTCAALAFTVRTRGSQAGIEGSMGKRCSPVLDIVKEVVGDFKNTLADYVLVRSGWQRISVCRQCIASHRMASALWGGFLLDSKLERLEALRQLVDQLLLAPPHFLLSTHFHSVAVATRSG
jgi:hypothetical protein